MYSKECFSLAYPHCRIKPNTGRSLDLPTTSVNWPTTKTVSTWSSVVNSWTQKRFSRWTRPISSATINSIVAWPPRVSSSTIRTRIICENNIINSIKILIASVFVIAKNMVWFRGVCVCVQFHISSLVKKKNSTFLIQKLIYNTAVVYWAGQHDLIIMII